MQLSLQAHADLLPEETAALFRAQLLSALAQVGINAAILSGGSRDSGGLTDGDTVEFLSDMASLAGNGWFGYEKSEPLFPYQSGDAMFDPPVGIQGIADGIATATIDQFTGADIVDEESTRSVGGP